VNVNVFVAIMMKGYSIQLLMIALSAIANSCMNQFTSKQSCV